MFFSRTSQGQNPLPRPGLEPGSSDSEPGTIGGTITHGYIQRQYVMKLKHTEN